MAIQAQEAERGPLYEITIMKVSPDNLDEFMEAAGMVKEAAVAANLDAKWGWQIWLRDFEVGIVSIPENMAAFDDEEAWTRAFEGTAGEELLNAAFEKIAAEVTATATSREVWELEEGWSYAPAEGGIEEVRFAEAFELLIKPGMEEAFEEVTADLVALMTELGGPYPLNGFRTVFGVPSRVNFIVLNDGWGDFFGPRSLEAGLEASGLGGEWEAIMDRMRNCVTETRTSRMTLIPDVSYAGPGM